MSVRRLHLVKLLTCVPSLPDVRSECRRSNILYARSSVSVSADSWDVINGSSPVAYSRDAPYPQLTISPEPFNDDGTWRKTIWYNTLNNTYIPLALHAAHLADPHAKLYINEYNTTAPGPKASALKALVRSLKAAGVPLHGIGVQAHEMVGEVPPLAAIKRNLEEFAALGVEVAITELDVRFATLPPDEEGLEQQRRDFETIVRACCEVEGCIGITVWDWTDKVSIERSELDSGGAGARGRSRFLF